MIESATPEKTDTILAKYLNAIPKEAVTKFAQDKYQILDPNNGVIVLCIFNQYIYGTINCANLKTQNRYLKELIARLKK